MMWYVGLRRLEYEQDYEDDPSDRFPDNPRSWRNVWTQPIVLPPLADPPRFRSEARIAELRAMSYADYLLTPEWVETRRDAIKAAEHRCARCRVLTQRLQVHHLTYERLGHEQPDDLEVLCAKCHRDEHGLS